MRITLLHNPKAGRKEFTGKQLIAALRDAGHKVTYRSTMGRSWSAAMAKPADLIIAAGGDGTVGNVARRLVGQKTPLSVLPLGTANNLARTLGFDQPVQKLIARIGEGKLKGFDVGLARGPWGSRYVFEGIGAGLLAEYLRLPKSKERTELSKEEEMREHVARLRKLLASYRARKWKWELDGEKMTDRYLLIEAMNICSVGPFLNLAPEARTDDGRFDLILAREAERDILMDYLATRLRGDKKAEFPLPSRAFRRLRIDWEKSPLHLDDDLWPEEDEKPPKPGEITLEVKPSALIVLRP